MLTLYNGLFLLTNCTTAYSQIALPTGLGPLADSHSPDRAPRYHLRAPLPGGVPRAVVGLAAILRERKFLIYYGYAQVVPVRG